MINDVQYQPRVSEKQAKEFLDKAFGVEADLTPLASERDQNYLVSPCSGENQWVLKLANLNANREHLELENAVMQFFQASPIANVIPGIQTNLNGDSIESLQTESGEHYARLVEYLPGKILAKVRPHSPHLLEDFGRVLGQFTASMVNFEIPTEANELKKEFHWDLDRFDATQAELRESVADVESLCPFIDRYHSRVAPSLTSLRKSLIQNDANDHNVIISPSSKWPQSVAGLIDFGDMVFASTVNELAIAIAYVMLHKSDPLFAAAHVVKGFNSEFQLEEAELEIIFDLACARLCTSVLMASHQRSLNPDNEYLSVTDQPARNLLKQFKNIDSDFASAIFRAACGHLPVNHSTQISEWIKKQESTFAPLLGQDLTPDNTLVFDLSVSSNEPLAGDLGSDAPEVIEQQLHARSKSVGIGRYLEPRICYQGDQFGDPSLTSTDYQPTESRTIHMGVDLFAKAGTSVSAPFAGKLHSFADNDIPFDYGPTIILEHEAPCGRFFTLYGHLDRKSLETLEVGQEISAGDCLARIGTQEENGGWAPHLHFQVMSHNLGMTNNFPGVVRASDLELWKSIILDPYDLAGVPRQIVLPLDPEPKQIESDRQRLLNPSLSLSYDDPLHVVRGRGQFLYDQHGHRYLDCVNNVCHVGHCHPKVVDAASNQLRLLNTNTRYLHDAITEYAKRLVSTLPAELDTCFFVNSGSEANDLALRLARNFTGREEVICVEGAYHGHVSSLIEVSPYKYNSDGGKGKPDHVFEIPMPDPYRGIHHQQENPTDKPGSFYANFIQDAIQESGSRFTASKSDRQNAAHDQQVAAFICESILSCGGQIVLPDQFLELAYAHCRDHGILCIADEVQVGFGRVGESFWGFELQNVVPDIVTMGKPIGNGFPLGAVVTTRQIADAFNNGMEYFNTYGGNPVACSAGLAVLDVIEDEQLQQRARSTGNQLLTQLEALKAENACIGDVRGKGLFVGIEFVKDQNSKMPAPELARYLVERMKLFGVLLSTDGPDKNVIKIKPPLCFGENDVEQLVSGLRTILNEDYVKSFDE